MITTMPIAPIRLGLPWLQSHYAPMNGSHPLVESFLHGNQGVLANDLSPDLPSQIPHRHEVLRRLIEQGRHLTPQACVSLIEWLDVDAQYSMEAQAHLNDLLFLHTTPLYAGSQPFIFHFESFTSLFMPFIFGGENSGVDLRSQGCFQLVRQALEAPNCRRIFSHMRSSIETLAHVFDSPIIAAKCHCVPLGLSMMDNARALEKFERPGPLRIMFTNSLHHHPNSFYLRGGHHLLEAFFRLRKSIPDIELSILSSVPRDLAERFTQAHTAGVTWYDKRIDDASLKRLLLEHHFFAVPAAGLHSFSLLRAFSHGCVPIVSDAPGYDEYISDLEDSVVTVRGVREQIYRKEEGGWTSEHYAPFTQLSEDFVDQLHHKILALAQRPNARVMLRDMAERNLTQGRDRFDPARSHAQFNAMLAAH